MFTFGFAIYISLQLNHAKEVVQANSEVPPPVVFYLESLLKDAVRGSVIETIGPQGGYQDPSRAANMQPTEFYGRRIEMNGKTLGKEARPFFLFFSHGLSESCTTRESAKRMSAPPRMIPGPSGWRNAMAATTAALTGSSMSITPATCASVCPIAV